MQYKILPVEKIIGAILKQNESRFTAISPTNSISYSWGDNQELTSWIIAKDKEISGNRAFGIENRSKYPLIFLIAPFDADVIMDENIVNDIQFIICCDTKLEYLNQDREVETMETLTAIGNAFIDVLKTHKNTSILSKSGEKLFSYKKIYNYPIATTIDRQLTAEKNETLDIWDAYVLKFNLKIDSNCLSNTDLKLCQ